jgi:hypothetical protein
VSYADDIIRAKAKRAVLQARYPELFDDGARLGFLGKIRGPRERGDYPIGFHKLEFAARNAWFAGWNQGRIDREAAR